MPEPTTPVSDQRQLIERDIDAYLAQHERKEILRILTCGSVDDGKSTLIGRLLHDSQLIHEDQLEAVERESRTGGSRAGELDLALVLDGLQAEREQGITIDVAYRYFSTARRKYIIADTPGHEQYTRNMATGASTCDAAIILIDAANGVLTQTRRHTFIARLLGIRHLVVAVNKMDLADYDEAAFSAIREDYEAFASRLRVEDLNFIPMSALHGDNVVERSENMPWYRGASLMHVLENMHIAPGGGIDNFRMPVQRVNRPDASFRGYSGSVASGAVRPGDAVVVLPSGLETNVTRIVSMDGDIEEAVPPMAVTLTLADQIDISRGDVLASPENQPRVSDTIDATLVWMGETEMTPGRQYVLKQGTKKVFCRVETLRDRVDVNTLEPAPASTLALNEIGRVRLVLSEPIAHDAYEESRATGSFIVIDRVSNITVGAGMIQIPGGQASRSHWDETPHGALTAANPAVTREEKAQRLGQTPVTVLFTGLSKSGKTVIAQAVERKLFDEGRLATVIDGQNFRLGLSRDLGFSAEDRSENVRRAAESARQINDAGLICLTAFVVPLDRVRERARAVVGSERFLEVFLTAPMEELKRRDESGLFEAAERGEIPSFPGVSSEFEAPTAPDLVLDTASLDVDECAQRVMELLQQRGFIR